jgi:hypothetical protein
MSDALAEDALYDASPFNRRSPDRRSLRELIDQLRAAGATGIADTLVESMRELEAHRRGYHPLETESLESTETDTPTETANA